MLVWLGSLAAVLILAVGFALWRLMQGPIDLDPLVPYVEAAFKRAGIGVGINISGVRFGIDRTTHELRLWAENVRVALANGEPVASFPEMATSFGLGPLLRGRLLPTQLSVERPVLHLKRHEGGSFTFRIGEAEEGAADLGPQILDQLTGGSGSLRRLRIHDATVIVDDKSTDRRWRMTHVDAAIQRGAEGLQGDVSLALPMGPRTPELRANFRYRAADHKADIALAADGIDPAALAPLFPQLRPLAQLHSPISGTLTTRIDLSAGQSEGIRLDLGLGAGRWQNAALPTGALDFVGGELHAVYAPERRQLHLDNFALDLGDGARLVIDGSLDGLAEEALTGRAPPPSNLDGKLGVVLSHVATGRLDKLWPAELSPGARRWVLANIHDGAIDEVSAQIVGRIDAAAPATTVLAAQGKLRFHDLTVTYVNGLLPVRKAAGTATFTDKRVDITPTAGTVKSLKFTGGALTITDVGSPTEWLTVDVGAAGLLQDALEVIDAKPLHYAHAVGLDPARIGGRAEAQLHFRLPLLADLKLDAIDYGVKATLAGVSINKAALDRNLTDGNFTIDVARSGVHLQGPARFDGTPLTIDGEVPFRPGAGPHMRYRVGLKIDDETRRRLGIDYAPEALSGTVGVDLTYSAFDAGRGEAVATLDLQGASLAIAEASWKKAPETPGSAKVVIDLDREWITRLPEIEIRAAGLDGRFAVKLTADHRQIERVDIKRLVLANSDLSGVVVQRPGGGWRADLRGARVDGSHFLKQDNAASPSSNAPPLALTGHFDRVMMAPRRELHNVSLQLLRSGGVWQSAQVDARYAGGRQLSLQLGGEGPSRRLIVHSDDLGATLGLLGVTDHISGGRLDVNAQVSEEGGKRTIRGQAEGFNYNVVRAPAFAQLLGATSFGGVAGAMAGTGIPFQTIRADFTLSGDRLLLSRLVTYGDALGITANGWFDIGRDWVEMQGTLAPAYALNSIFGIVPVIGTLLTGGEGQGLIAANYHLSGSADNPQVSVNPLSALAPGFLRKLFEFGMPGPQPEQEAAHGVPATPQAPTTPAPRLGIAPAR